jgi:hypothetical protein
MVLSAPDKRPTERRQGLRIRQERPVKVYEPRLGRYFGGHTRDASATGLRLELPASASLAAGQLISLHVGGDMPGESLVRNHEMVPGRVVWLNRDDAVRGRLLAGIQLLQRQAAAMDAA